MTKDFTCKISNYFTMPTRSHLPKPMLFFGSLCRSTNSKMAKKIGGERAPPTSRVYASLDPQLPAKTRYHRRDTISAIQKQGCLFRPAFPAPTIPNENFEHNREGVPFNIDKYYNTYIWNGSRFGSLSC